MTPQAPVRVLIVDDSATVRAVLRRLFSRAEGIEIAGEATDGANAVEATLRLRPDVVLMDIEMPGTDGYAATEQIMALHPTPILVLSSRAARDRVRTAFEAIRRGALEVIPKPADTAEWEALAFTLPVTVRAVAAARLPGGGAPRARESGGGPSATHGAAAATGPGGPRTAAAWPGPVASIRYIAVGASTGGPTAVRDLLAALPEEIPASVLVVQHIAAGFEASLAEWLASDLHRAVRLARDGECPRGGEIRIAPAGAHLLLGGDGALHLDAVSPPRRGHRPSADDLFRACAVAFPTRTAGVLLSGMGSDGAEGLADLRRAGGVTVVQDEASSVVFGMPRAALECGAADTAMPPGEIGAALGRCLLGVRR
jgi:two-component system chemotaxis response regulator CheB